MRYKLRPTVLIKVLALRVSINPNAWIESANLTPPILSRLDHQILQPRAGPQLLRKGRIVDLETVVDPKRLALFRSTRRRNEGKSGEEGDVGSTQSSGEEVADHENLVVQYVLKTQVTGGDERTKRRPLWSRCCCLRCLFP